VGRAAAFLMGGLAACAALASCAAPPRSMTLSLSLRPGMERTMRFVTEQRITGTALRGAGAAGGAPRESPAGSGLPRAASLRLTYTFRVVSVDGSGLAVIESTLRDAAAPQADRAMTRALDAMKRDRVIMTMDRSGRVMRMQSDGPLRFQLPGLPADPAAETRGTPAQGDLARLFNGFTGRTVSVGETWTTAMSAPQGAPGLKGTLQWTLSAVTDTSARLSYTGALNAADVGLSPSAAVRRAGMTGTVSGFVSLERSTGWPERGSSTVRAEVATGGAPGGAGGAAAAGRGVLSLNVVTTFDEMP
jgi:hypothetical protein